MHPERIAIEPTDEQLRAAWRDLALPGWGTLEDAAHAAARYALVRAHASRRARGLRPEPPAASPQHAPAHAPHPRTAPPLPRTAPTFSRKSAASGEREGD